MPIEKIAVIGSGLMGHGIAQVAATSGQEVSLIDLSDELLRKAMEKIEGSLSKLSEKGKIREEPRTILKRIKTTTKFPSSLGDADYVIEAVPEDINLKKKIIGEVDKYASTDAILATNTSGLSITLISEATRRKERVIGMHWMNPPQIMKVIEVIKGKYTENETIQATIELCRLYNKEPIIAHKDIWSFLTGRSHAGWMLEACLMYLRGDADFREIDAVSRYKIGLPMGEFELMDFVGGVDIRVKGIKSLEQILGTYPDFEPWPAFLAVNKHLNDRLFRPMSEKGLCGLKTGKGFYNYDEGRYIRPEISEHFAEKVEPIQLLAPAINVASWCVCNGIGNVDDINKSFRLAYGWPKGIFEFIDEYDVKSITNVLKTKEKKAPEWLKDFYKADPVTSLWGS